MGVDAHKLRFFADYIEASSGIVYGESNHFQLVRRLEQISDQLGLKGVEELYHQAKTGVEGSLKDLLLDVATNNETSFFRDPTVFRAIERAVLPTLVANGRPLRIWSAASSTGQEAYSLAMMLDQMRLQGAHVPEHQILATDISERVLSRAAEGVYTQLEVQRGLSAKLLITYFEKRPDGWVAKPDLRRRVRFQRLNLLGPWPGLPTFDLILCRNVLIYQSLANKSKVLRRLHDQLRPGGVLVLGATETMLGLPERTLFRDERADGVFVFRRPAS